MHFMSLHISIFIHISILI
ncbi:hypothetical protein CAEBREN_10638 [Caenorhabditis brenneri]|uniref:Uncharacterized protein n=1 Tax=Caenorhabditis brenneri TaxID=135651 RepID=G0MRJ6_CAEBE|nr:hypothetical protein CAEBREN_10638 [Caenorhabditis brenneri]